MKFSYEYFCKEYTAFREIMGSKKYSQKQIRDGFRGLIKCVVKLDCSVKQKEQAIDALDSLLRVEIPMRFGLMNMQSLEKLFQLIKKRGE